MITKLLQKINFDQQLYNDMGYNNNWICLHEQVIIIESN